ncbi:phosphoribosylanthranilate isomerase [Salibacterium halotolerans]|uniref:N-(5'-phosphoribosyl)anthranilate isomerase n=1 Tax=Salibacterium halotolerans TaxID=1884432 RepID=A0A1I5Q6H8_9BACI|nr:phosphoribosylanthranilate isomerase [Salibacterium halotolerans]SFP41958.1 phosphoribosylanthranilate isomerase [Salibacterium halotolerans]
MSVPKLKLCGLHSLNDVFTVSESSADYAGFVMAESRRRVSPETAKAWLDTCPLPGKKIAVLFVNAPLEEIERTVEIVNPDIIQLQGDETVRDLEFIKNATGREIWKAVPHDTEALEKMKQYEAAADGFIVDAKVKGARGGTGQQFDWSHVPGYVSFGKERGIPVLIAGGVNPDNAGELVKFHPWGVDVSSGIETEGQKDKSLVMEMEKRLNNNENHVS